VSWPSPSWLAPPALCPMKKRLGNFILLCGLICLTLFFTTHTFGLDQGLFFFGSISLISLGLLLKRSARSRKAQDKKRRRGGEDALDEGRYD
jgi:hypothetical protein